MSGYKLWHRRLAHSSNQNIRDTIYHSIGLEDLKTKKFDSHEKCRSCMIGKSTLEDLPKLKDRATEVTEPQWQVKMDSFSSSVTSIEGYNRRIRALAKNTVTDSLGASLVASGAHRCFFLTIRLYTNGRSQPLSVVAIRFPICYNRVAKIV